MRGKMKARRFSFITRGTFILNKSNCCLYLCIKQLFNKYKNAPRVFVEKKSFTIKIKFNRNN